MEKRRSCLLFLIILLSSMLAGCTAENGPADTVLSYYQALAAKDADRLSLLSCADWEAQAQVDLQSFGAVTVSLEEPACEQAGEDGGYTLISCTGKILADYGNEVLEIDLSDRTYLTANEGGEWRMCGYR